MELANVGVAVCCTTLIARAHDHLRYGWGSMRQSRSAGPGSERRPHRGMDANAGLPVPGAGGRDPLSRPENPSAADLQAFDTWSPRITTSPRPGWCLRRSTVAGGLRRRPHARPAPPRRCHRRRPMCRRGDRLAAGPQRPRRGIGRPQPDAARHLVHARDRPLGCRATVSVGAAGPGARQRRPGRPHRRVRHRHWVHLPRGETHRGRRPARRATPAGAGHHPAGGGGRGGRHPLQPGHRR